MEAIEMDDGGTRLPDYEQLPFGKEHSRFRVFNVKTV